MYPFSLPWCMCIPVKVGIPEFLNGVGKGVETHIPKLEAEIGEFQKLLVTRTLKLKKLGIPCKHVRVDLIFLLFMIQCDLLFSLFVPYFVSICVFLSRVGTCDSS